MENIATTQLHAIQDIFAIRDLTPANMIVLTKVIATDKELAPALTPVPVTPVIRETQLVIRIPATA